MGIREDPGTFNGEGPQGHIYTCSRGTGSVRAGETEIIPKKDAPKSVLFIGVNNKSPGRGRILFINLCDIKHQEKSCLLHMYMCP